MPPGFPRRHLDQKGRAWIAFSFLLAAGIRCGFTLAFPTIHGGDAAARLAHADTLVLGYQLPLPQMLVVLGRAMSDDPLLVRLIFCLWGAALAAGISALLGLVSGSRAALFGGLLAAFDPLLIHYSIVPYQEPVAYGLLAWAFYLATSGRTGVGAMVMAAACLCRYEAWLFLPFFVWISGAPRSATLAGIPVLAWIAWWRGLAPSGLYVLDIALGQSRMTRVDFLSGKLLEYETAFLPAIAVLALLIAVRERARSLLLGSAGLSLIVAAVVAFGHEYPPGSGLMSERLIHLPVLGCLALSAAALARASKRSLPAFAACLAAVIAFAGRNAQFETALLRTAAREPDLVLAREVAGSVQQHRAPAECVSVAAPPIDPALLRTYVAKVATSFGDIEQARARAAALADTSPDRDRIAAHLKARTGTVRTAPGCPLLVIIDEARPVPQPAALVAEISAGTRRARILRIPR